MIDALVAGKLWGRPEQRTGKSGKPFTVAKVRAPTADGETLFVNVVAFSEAAQAALLALGDGEAVSLAGTLTPKVWTDREGQSRPALDMVASQVLTAYHVKRRRDAMAERPAAPTSGTPAIAPAAPAAPATGRAAAPDWPDSDAPWG